MNMPGGHRPGSDSRLSWHLDPERSPNPRRTLAATTASLVLVPFALLALLVLADWAPLYEFDRRLADTFHGYAIRHPTWVRLMSWWTDMFAPTPLRFGALVLVLWLLRRGARWLALWVTVTMAAGGVLGVLLKLLVGRHRPDPVDPVATAVGFAFPSGHTLTATLAAGVLLVLFLPTARDRPAPWWALWTGAVLLALVTGLSRIALGVHWASDVLGGWLLGTTVVTATFAGVTTWQARVDRCPGSAVREGIGARVGEDRPAADPRTGRRGDTR